MSYQIRLSRYDPSVDYAANPTWTSIFDVGTSFAGVELEQAEYERVEQLYLDAIVALLRDGGSPSMRLGDVHTPISGTTLTRDVRDGSVVLGAEVPEICRLVLREELSCRLDSDEMYIHFGFDLYVYIGGAKLKASTVETIERLGLFVELDIPSPYSTT